jgi:hypothetical protein
MPSGGKSVNGIDLVKATLLFPSSQVRVAVLSEFPSVSSLGIKWGDPLNDRHVSWARSLPGETVYIAKGRRIQT